MSNAVSPAGLITVEDKHKAVMERIASLGSAAVTFSGGVDSALLLKLAYDALGRECVAVTAVSPSLPKRELAQAESFAAGFGIRHELVETNELQHQGYRNNESNRCYFCKSELFEHAFSAAQKLGLNAVLYGANADDVGDHRPGMRAAKERGAVAPLLEVGMTKADVRALSKSLNLPTWDKPAMACLSSRFPYGTAIDQKKLAQIESAETVLRERGYRVLRVRYHGPVARLELGHSEWTRIQNPQERQEVALMLKRFGFAYIAVDLEPFASGRLNQTLSD